MEKLLQIVFDGSNPHYTRWQFTSMINIGGDRRSSLFALR